MNSELALFEQFAGKSARGIPRLNLPRKFLFGLMLLGRPRIIPYAAQVYESTVEAFHSLYHPDARHMRVSCIDFVIHGVLLANYQWIVA
ncbi:hypothetical protein LMG28614_06637 [Paraburkholderia ultramafica]|uniref:Uncharacterized protein n=1 Tax=Paraburkholderia ultramafica TaxID=1544867 RepID=A0A6S7C2F2_9BURK|nr:hypothetical protein LMG28614_06637 [Paraburkholderia ultramafica]